MKDLFPFIVATSFVLGGCMTSQQGQHEHALSKSDVIALADSGVDDEEIIRQIRVTKSTFDVQPEDVKSLLDVGLNSRVIREMMSSRPRWDVMKSETNARPNDTARWLGAANLWSWSYRAYYGFNYYPGGVNAR